MWSKLYYTQYTPLSNVYINTKIKLVILHTKKQEECFLN